MKHIIFFLLVLVASPCFAMEKHPELTQLRNTFLKCPSQQAIMPLQNKVFETIIIKHPQNSGLLFYQLSCCWWQLLQAGDQEAELRYKQFLKLAAATTKDPYLQDKIARILTVNTCHS